MKLTFLALFIALLTQKSADAAIVASTCFGSNLEFEYLLFDESLNAQSALDTCRLNDGDLGRISSIEEHQVVANLVSGTTLGDFWVGKLISVVVILFLPGIADTTGESDPTGRFVYLDGENNVETLSFIHTNAGVFPWSGGEPNNDQDCVFFGTFCSGGEFCVSWKRSNNLFNDNECTDNKPFLCRRACSIIPTEAPTAVDEKVGEGAQSASTAVLILAMVVLGAIVAVVGMSLHNSRKIVKMKQELILQRRQLETTTF